MAAGGHFGCPKLTIGGISGHFRSIQNFFFFNFSTKWPPVPILDATLNFCEIFDKMTAVGQFGFPRITFDHISGHFRYGILFFC